MVQIAGNAGHAVVASTGIDIPLEPRRLSEPEQAARQARQADAIAAAETTAAARAQAALPRPARPKPARTRPVAKKPATKTLPSPTSPATVAASSVTAGPAKPMPTSPSAPPLPTAADPGHEVPVKGAAEVVEALRGELRWAREEITRLQVQVKEQARGLFDAAAEVQVANSRVDQIAAWANDQVRDLTTRAEAGEQALAEARAQITTDENTETPVAAAITPGRPTHRPGPAECLGGCGVALDPAYVQRTGRQWHGGPCADLVQASPALAKERAA